MNKNAVRNITVTCGLIVAPITKITVLKLIIKKNNNKKYKCHHIQIKFE